MPIATLALLGALIVAPTPSPTTALSVSPVSTCDNLIVGIFNGSAAPVTLTPDVAGYQLDPLTVLPGDNVPFTVPGEDGRELALTTDNGVRLGPWVWREPEGCSDVPPAGSALRDEGPRIVMKDPNRSAALWVFLLGFIITMIGVYAMVNHRLRARRHRYVDRTARVQTRIGRHRARPDSLLEKALSATRR